MSTVQARRMAINREAAIEFSMRNLPMMPDDVVRRFPDLQKYNEALQQWSRDTQNMIRSILSMKLDAPDSSTQTVVTTTPTKWLVYNADVANSAYILESKLDLNYPTHSNANDPTTSQKGALTGSYGVPNSANPYVTSNDPRLTGGSSLWMTLVLMGA